MSGWHRATCRKADVYFVGGVPFCSACDASPDCHSIDPDASPGIAPAPELPVDGIRNLSWPPSVKYWHYADYDPASGQNLNATSKPTVSSVAGPAIVPSASHEVYARLEQTNQVRLLKLSKSDFDDPIHGTLITSSLDGETDFEALSYAWADETGDNSRRKIIFLGPIWNTFKVTANCFAALRRMRKAKEDILVWVDAVCIDQGNHAERNHQVGLMAKIYSSARELFVYLGEGDKELERALIRLTWSNEAKSIDPELIQRLFQCRYFSRMWIIQEVANAKTASIHYGASSIKWAILSEKRLLSIFGRDIVQSIPRWITTIYNQPRHTVSDLPHLLLNTALSEAADTRDQVFALFGLLGDAADNVLTADYALATPMVFTGIAAFVLMNLGHHWTLNFAIGTNTKQLPTWVPDWRAVQRDPKVVDSSAGPAEQAANDDSEAYVPTRPGSPDRNINLGVRVSNSGCLITPAATLMTANEFPMHWARSVQDPPLACKLGQFQFSVAGVQGVPPGKIVIFPQTHSLFYLESDYVHPSRHKIRGTCRFLCPLPLALDSQDSSNSHCEPERTIPALDALRSFCDRRLRTDNLSSLARLDRHISDHLRPQSQPNGYASRPSWNTTSIPPDAFKAIVHMYVEGIPWDPHTVEAISSVKATTEMRLLLECLHLWETEAFWSDVAVASKIAQMCREWLQLMAELSILSDPPRFSRLEHLPLRAWNRAERDWMEWELKREQELERERRRVLTRWAGATCALVNKLPEHTTNKLYQDARLRVRVKELVLVFLPTDQPYERSMTGMTEEELETLVQVTLDECSGPSEYLLPTEARASDQDDGTSVWYYNSCQTFMEMLIPSDEDQSAGKFYRTTFSMCAFLRALLPQKRTWEELRIH